MLKREALKLLPFWGSAAIDSDLRPRPVQVGAGSLGLVYFGAALSLSFAFEV